MVTATVAFVRIGQSLSLVTAFAIAQDVAPLLAEVASALFLLNRRRDFVAGLVFPICAIKFHVCLLVPVWILACRLRRFAVGLAVEDQCWRRFP
jgi:hypothetical protein